jgi:DNA-binding SARP family transcriptional activator
MPDLRLSFIGPPLVSVRGEHVELSPRKSLALLAYLAVTAARHGRDALAELLFPELDRERARAGVRQCLSILRNAIGEQWVGTEGESIWLREGKGLWLDVRELERLTAEIGKAEQ